MDLTYSAERDMGDTFSGVRMAGSQDDDRVFDHLLKLYNENSLFPISGKKVMEAIKTATEGRGGIIGLIEGAGGNIEASVGLFIETFWYTDALNLSERWNYVEPDHRKSTHAKKLIEFSKWSSEKIGIPLFMGIVSNIRTDAKVRLYRRQLPYLGAFFAYGMKGLEDVRAN